jgi:catechol 2,3-dioxygenase-like lactoylglutathione lyase family enzyme
MIQHVTRAIAASKLEESLAFYGLLGFRQVDVPPDLAGRAVWLELGATQLHLMLADEVTAEQGHVGVVIENYEATVAQLRRAGYFVDPRREHWGSPRVYVRDPGGHLVELMAFGPGQPAE